MKARNQIRVQDNVESTRQAITNKYDKARLLHLRMNPVASGDWTSAKRENSKDSVCFFTEFVITYYSRA